ncbi:MAG: hypothetical protein FWF10_05060 [Clostridiales bacterium]|nr:hypothetical protein [Clostridiales bacterium]
MQKQRTVKPIIAASIFLLIVAVVTIIQISIFSPPRFFSPIFFSNLLGRSAFWLVSFASTILSVAAGVLGLITAKYARVWRAAFIVGLILLAVSWGQNILAGIWNLTITTGPILLLITNYWIPAFIPPVLNVLYVLLALQLKPQPQPQPETTEPIDP